jgi:hypothetical protein
VKTDEEVLERVTGLTGAVIRVGDGRGFVVERARQRLVTAAHCLPHLPPAHPMSHTEERTYEALLGPLGAEPTVWAECLFADPVADIAILDGPDNQALFDQAEACEEFLADKVALKIGDAPKEGYEQEILSPPGGSSFTLTVKTEGRGTARLLSLDDQWIECRVERGERWLSVVEEGLVASGVSGSPIVMADRAIGLISTGGLNPVLKDCLPAWFFRPQLNLGRIKDW